MHFTLIANETTSQGREVLSVCPQLLDFIADPSNPIKREVLIDMCDLPGTTGAAITTAILNSVQKHAIDITNCRGEAYYANASMSSDKKGVQAEIARCAPDAEYQGCCLLSINLVICHACKIKSIQNMMDSCHELFSFFDNSPKRQKFLSIVIDALSPENKKHRLKDLYESRGPPCLKQFSNCMNTVSLCWMRDVYPQMMTSGFTQTTKNGTGMPKLRQWQMDWDIVWHASDILSALFELRRF